MNERDRQTDRLYFVGVQEAALPHIIAEASLALDTGPVVLSYNYARVMTAPSLFLPPSFVSPVNDLAG